MPSVFARPSTDDTLAEWKDELDGTTNIYTHIDEPSPPSDADYIYNIANSPSSYRSTLSNPGTVQSGSDHIIRWRYKKTNPSAWKRNVILFLLNKTSGTEITRRTFNDIGTAWTQDTYGLTTAEISAIVSYSDLQIRIAITTSGSGAETGVSVSWVEIEFAPAFVATAFSASPGVTNIDIAAGRGVIVVVSIPGSETVSSVIDSGGSSYSQLRVRTQATATRVEVWGALNANTSSSVTVTLSASAKFVVCIGLYLNVEAFGNLADNVGTIANPTVTDIIQDNNNVVVAGFVTEGTTLPTAKTGNLRAKAATAGGGGASNCAGTFNDNNGTTAGASVINAVTLTATDWAAVAVELRLSQNIPHGLRMMRGLGK